MYEARQNKENVSRSISGSGNGTLQRVGFTYVKSDRDGFKRVIVKEWDSHFNQIERDGCCFAFNKYYEYIRRQNNYIELYEADQKPYPTGVKCVNPKPFNDANHAGLVVDLELISNTGEIRDIYDVSESEVVSVSIDNSGIFKDEKIQSSNSSYMPIGNVSVDKHLTPKSHINELLNKKKNFGLWGGTYIANQLDIYRKPNGEEKAIEHSGYEIKRDVRYGTINGTMNILIETTKKPNKVSIGNYSVEGGKCSETKASVNYQENDSGLAEISSISQ